MTCKEHNALFDGLEYILEDIAQDLSDIEKELHDLGRRFDPHDDDDEEEEEEEKEDDDNDDDSGEKYGLSSKAQVQEFCQIKKGERRTTGTVLSNRKLSDACLQSLGKPCVCVTNLPGRVVHSDTRIKDYIMKAEVMKKSLSQYRVIDEEITDRIIKTYSRLVHELRTMNNFVKQTMSDIVKCVESSNQTSHFCEFGSVLSQYVITDENCNCCSNCVWVLKVFYDALMKQILFLQQNCAEQRFVLFKEREQRKADKELYYFALPKFDKASDNATSSNKNYRLQQTENRNDKPSPNSRTATGVQKNFLSNKTKEGQGILLPSESACTLTNKIRRSYSTAYHMAVPASQRSRAKSVSRFPSVSSAQSLVGQHSQKSPALQGSRVNNASDSERFDEPVYSVYTDFLGPLPRRSSEDSTWVGSHSASWNPRISTSTIPRTALDDLSYYSFTSYAELGSSSPVPSLENEPGHTNTKRSPSRSSSCLSTRETITNHATHPSFEGTNISLLKANETKIVKSCGINVIHKARKFLSRWSDFKHRKKSPPCSKVIKNVAHKFDALKPSHWTRERDGTQWRELQTTKPKSMRTVIPCGARAETSACSSIVNTSTCKKSINKDKSKADNERNPAIMSEQPTVSMKIMNHEEPTQHIVNCKPPRPEKPKGSKPVKRMVKTESTANSKFHGMRSSILRLPLSTSYFARKSLVIDVTKRPQHPPIEISSNVRPRTSTVYNGYSEKQSNDHQNSGKRCSTEQARKTHSLSFEGESLTPETPKATLHTLQVNDGCREKDVSFQPSLDSWNCTTMTEKTRDSDCKQESVSVQNKKETALFSVLMSTPKDRNSNVVLNRNSISQKHLKMEGVSKQKLFQKMIPGGQSFPENSILSQSHLLVNSDSTLPSISEIITRRKKSGGSINTKPAVCFDVSSDNVEKNGYTLECGMKTAPKNGTEDTKFSSTCFMEATSTGNSVNCHSDNGFPIISMLDSAEKLCFSSFFRDDVLLNEERDFATAPVKVEETKAEVIKPGEKDEDTNGSDSKLQIATNSADNISDKAFNSNNDLMTSLSKKTFPHSSQNLFPSSCSSVFNVTYVISNFDSKPFRNNKMIKEKATCVSELIQRTDGTEGEVTDGISQKEVSPNAQEKHISTFTHTDPSNVLVLDFDHLEAMCFATNCNDNREKPPSVEINETTMQAFKSKGNDCNTVANEVELPVFGDRKAEPSVEYFEREGIKTENTNFECTMSNIWIDSVSNDNFVVDNCLERFGSSTINTNILQMNNSEVKYNAVEPETNNIEHNNTENDIAVECNTDGNSQEIVESSLSDVNDSNSNTGFFEVNTVNEVGTVCRQIQTRHIEKLKGNLTYSDISSSEDNSRLFPDHQSLTPCVEVVGSSTQHIEQAKEEEPMDVSSSVSRYLHPVRRNDFPQEYGSPRKESTFHKGKSSWHWKKGRHVEKRKETRVLEHTYSQNLHSNNTECDHRLTKMRGNANSRRLKGLQHMFNLYPYLLNLNMKEANVRHLLEKYKNQKLESPLFEGDKIEINQKYAEQLSRSFPESPKYVARELVYRTFTIGELYRCRLSTGTNRKRTNSAFDRLNSEMEEAVKNCFFKLFPKEEFYWFSHCVPYINNSISRFFRCHLRKPAFRFLFYP